MKAEHDKHSLSLLSEIEQAIKRRLGRSLLLDTLSPTEIEQLAWLTKESNQPSNEQLSKALNEMLDT